MSKPVVGVLLLLVGLLCACGGQPTDHLPRPYESSLKQRWTGKEYVALGDSYTAGPNIGGQAAMSGRKVCGQSDQNYPHLLAQRLGLKLTDVSCGGAQTSSMTGHQQREGVDVPPQLDALGTSTRLVTLSVGGNDGYVFGNLTGRCLSEGMQDPEGAPCTHRIGDVAAVLQSYRTALSGRLLAVVKEIQVRAPNAEVLVVGYPQLVPEHGTCRTLLPLAVGDYPLLRKVIDTIDEAMRSTAEKADVTYVDVASAVAGHDICSSDPWIAGIRPGPQAAPFHPLAEEQQAVATQVEEALAH